MAEVVGAILSSAWETVSYRVSAHVEFLSRPHDLWEQQGGWIFFLNWAVQFFCSWAAFSIYIIWDYRNYKEGKLETSKLPSRHPMIPFWWSQIRMVPMVLYNQLVVWPLVFLLLIWPQWVISQRTAAEWPGGYPSLIVSMLLLLLISDQMWYWSHRLMHTKWCWKHLHKLHHVAENTAISATYVHPIEYAMFTLAMNLPWALVGFPHFVHVFPLGWGMFTGSGAHSGYSGDFANGDKHNAHHLFHNCNFGKWA
jgi:sterol desaturase/sphingolipid hydroxylase (fatty acid hydroxylase superfamily)